MVYFVISFDSVKFTNDHFVGYMLSGLGNFFVKFPRRRGHPRRFTGHTSDAFLRAEVSYPQHALSSRLLSTRLALWRRQVAFFERVCRSAPLARRITSAGHQVVQQVFFPFSSNFFSISLAVHIVFLAEMVPTTARSLSMCIINTFLGMGTITAVYIKDVVPLLVRLVRQVKAVSYKPTPFLIMASLCFLASAMVLILPETKGAEMPEEVKDIPAPTFSINVTSERKTIKAKRRLDKEKDLSQE